jgi:hypothetical protein
VDEDEDEMMDWDWIIRGAALGWRYMVSSRPDNNHE